MTQVARVLLLTNPTKILVVQAPLSNQKGASDPKVTTQQSEKIAEMVPKIRKSHPPKTIILRERNIEQSKARSRWRNFLREAKAAVRVTERAKEKAREMTVAEEAEATGTMTIFWRMMIS
jgi:preprotein translocase subunit SecD